MKLIAISKLRANLSRLIRAVKREDIIITRHGKPAGVLIGFETEDDWFDYRLEHDPRFVERVERARESLRKGAGVRLEDLDSE